MAQEPDKTLHSPAHAQGPTLDTLAMGAVLLAEDGWTDEQIARYLGISRRMLARWKMRPDMVLMSDTRGIDPNGTEISQTSCESNARGDDPMQARNSHARR